MAVWRFFRNFTDEFCVLRTALLYIFLAYYFALLVVARLTGAKGSDNSTFYSGKRRSPWLLVAIGMIGSSVSGVSFVSVPGMVMTSGWSYMQMVLGFFFGYLVIAFVLLPVYYKHRLTSIYGYLDSSIGTVSRRTASAFFIISKLAGAAIRFYVVVYLIHTLAVMRYGVPFAVTALALTVMMWLYTRQNGIKTLVYTDVIQTVCLLACAAAICFITLRHIGATPAAAWDTMRGMGLTSCFNFTD